MKKTTLTIVASVLFAGLLNAQTIQEGMNHLYAGHAKTAQSVFEKILSTSSNNVDATYWLGQAYLGDEEDEVSNRLADARQLYEKALASMNNAPLIQVGLGQVELLEGKNAEARQHFDAALAATSNKKGNDPKIETAIGRAIVSVKNGDYNYAVTLLEDAAKKDAKNTETLLQLGNAYRKAGEGKGGGQAYTAYNQALAVNSNFAVASYRLAKLFESQKNWDLVVQYLNDAVTKDPNFSHAYYDLFYYYFFRQKFTEAESYLTKYISSKGIDADAQDQFLYAQLCWAQKNFDCATAKGESVVAAMGNKTKPKVYRLLADAYLQKGDYVNSKKYSDLFFQYKKMDDYIAYDHALRAKILSKTGGTPDEILKNYLEGALIDTVLSSKIDFLKEAATYFRENKLRDKEAAVIQKIIELKPSPTINDYFDLTTAYYFGQNYAKSRDAALVMETKWPDQVYGYEWALNNSRNVDTVKKDSIAVPDALKLYNFAIADSVKYKKQIISSASFLAIYYANDAKNPASAIEYLKKWQSADPDNADNIQKNIDVLQKALLAPTKPTPATKPPAKTGGSKTSAVTKPKPGANRVAKK
ncbi:MAG: tetratricopeptide repeat protein [Bacteroidetes bacterium]|nr:tetratricopeptide repeat protein [Bacteroidota bacterium]